MVLPGDVMGVANATELPRERVLAAIIVPDRDAIGPDPGMAEAADDPAVADAIATAAACAHSSTVTTPGSLSAS